MAVARGPLVGRDAERAAVRERLTALRDGIGGTVLVTGEAGIGKTRLLAEVADLASGLGVLSGRAVAGGGAYRPLAEALAPPLRAAPLPDSPRLRTFRAALARLVPGTLGDAAAETSAGVDPAVLLGEGVLALLAALHPDGAVLVLDDLHWADADTLDLLAYLAGAVGRVPVVLALGARDDEGPDGAVAALTAHPDVAVLRPARLDAAAVAQLAARGAADPDELLRRSEGLPFLVAELLDAGTGTVPPSWTALVTRRLAALPDAARRVLDAAAVAPDDPDHRLLAGALGLDEATVLAGLRAAVAAGLLVPSDGRLTWRHALTRDAVLAALLPPDRAAVAGRLAAALEARDGPGDRETAADRHAEAGDRARATTLLLDLARRDADRGALGHADELLRRAATLGAAPGAVAVERVRVLTLRGEAADALAVGDAALASGAVTGDEHAELCLSLARAAVLGGRYAEAAERVARAARPDDPRSLVLAADAAFGAGDTVRATDRARAAVRAADGALASRGEAATLCDALLVLARCAVVADDAEVDALVLRAAAVAGEHGLAPRRVEALFTLGARRMSRGDATAADLARARDLAEGHGMVAHAAQADILRADAALHVHGPRAALAILRPAIEQLGRLRLATLQGTAELFAAASTALTGDRAAAEALLAAARTRADLPPDAAVLGPIVPALGALLAHDLPRAAALTDRVVPAVLAHRSAAPVPFYGLWPLLRAVLGDRDAEARDQMRGHHVLVAVPNRAALVYADAVAAGRAGRGEEAGRLAAAAAATLADWPWWHRLLRTVVLDAQVRDGWGDPVPALRADLAVHEQGDDAGARALARTCRDLLRAAGAPTRRSGDGVPPDLRRIGVTAREAEVLALVTEHRTNAEIAGRLHLSTRTVETHVARLLAKTGTTDRAQLRTRFATLDP